MGRATAPIITIIGYYGFANTGDEALLQSMITGLRQGIPEAELCVLSATPDQTARHHQVRAINRWDMRQVIRQLRRSHLLISGGGTLLQDATSLRSLLYYSAIVLAARWLGCPVFLYANGIGPLQTRLGRWLALRAIRAANAITLRDYRSLDALEQLLGTHSLSHLNIPVEVTGDPAFNLSKPSAAEARELLERLGIGSTRPLLGISLRPTPHLEESLPVLAAAINSFAQEEQCHCVLFPLQSPADFQVSRRFEPLLKVPCTLLPADLTPQEIMMLLQQMDAVVGIRLHALILAAAGGIPVAGIEYDPKVASFLVEVGQLNLGPLAGLEENRLTRELRRFWQERPRAREILAERVPILAMRARRNNQIALEIIERFQPRSSR